MNGAELKEIGENANRTSICPEDERDGEYTPEEVSSQQKEYPSKPLSPLQRRWRSLSTRWRRVILASAVLFVAIIITLIVVLAVLLSRAKAHSNQYRPPIASNGEFDNATASELAKYPIKLGLLTNFPDPAIYYDTPSKTWWVYGTNQGAGILDLDHDSSDLSHLSLANIQIATSTDFVKWNLVNTNHQPLPHPGRWTKQGVTNLTSLPYKDDGDDNDRSSIGPQLTLQVPRANVWAPEILHRPSDGQFVLYYAAALSNKTLHCIGAGVSPMPGGPFTTNDDAIICPTEKGGTIDPAVFIDEADNDTVYLVYKVGSDRLGHGGECNNMVAPQQPTPIMLQRMRTDGVTIDATFQAVQLLDRIEEDGPLIEAPSLVKANDYYFLFYSSGCTRFPDYTLRYAYSSSLTGPYSRAEPALVKTGDFGLYAPGSATIRYAQNVPGLSPEGSVGSAENSSGSWKLALHGRVNTTIGGVRAFFTAGLEFDGTRVRVIDGSTSVT